MPTAFESHPLIRFDGFELDVRAGELRKQGKRIRLQDQPLQVLQILLTYSGELVTREELKKRLWAADTFVDFDDGLNTAVKKLRDALGDSADKPRYIETLPRRGYRFIGTLMDPQPAEATASSIAQGPLVASGDRTRTLLFAFAIALTSLTAAFVFAGWKLYSASARVRTIQPRAVRSIVILPLENLSGDPSQDYFASGLTDTLTTELARIGSLRVTSRTSALRFKTQPLAKIARGLDVDAVLEGSVSRSGNRVRVNAQLIEARTDKHLWAQSYERDLHDLIALQGEIARDIAIQVQSTISQKAQNRFANPRNVDPKAYDLYLRAIPHLGLNNRSENDIAIELLERAVAIEPDFAVAYADLAIEYRTRATEIAPNQREYRERASVAVERALALDPDLPEAYLARARLLWTKPNHFPHEAAIIDLKHALDLDPNLAEAHHQLGNIYNHIGLLQQAQEQLAMAVKLDPTNAGIRFRIGINLLYQGKWEEALSAMSDSREFSPSLWSYQTAFALLQLGKIGEAKQRTGDVTRETTPEAAGLLESMQAMLAAKENEQHTALVSVHAAIKAGQQFQHFHHVAYGIAASYALMNNRDEALHWLRFTADDGFPCYPLFASDPNLDNLRQDPRFKEFMGQLETQWKHYGSVL